MSGIVADLHMHSTCSDGITPPARLLEQIEKSGLKAFSLTDHDSVEGHTVLSRAVESQFIPGIELTSTLDGKEFHILGYYINSSHSELLETIGKIAQKRVERLRTIVEGLNATYGFDMDFEKLSESIGEGSFNRLTLARFMVNSGLVGSLDACFAKYLGESSELYEAVNYFTPVDAVGLIHRSGGIAFLAHPFNVNVTEYLPALIENGLDGIEAYHPSHSTSQVRFCVETAERAGLGISGGSDYHGNEHSRRQLMASGLDDGRLMDFLELKPQGDCVSA